tara:strand:+ start:2445 stop:2591 length:147 start_codon:yes stop_codon:yes gene_type:complete
MKSEYMKIFEEQCRAMQKNGNLTRERQYIAMLMFLSEQEMKQLIRNKT